MKTQINNQTHNKNTKNINQQAMDNSGPIVKNQEDEQFEYIIDGETFYSYFRENCFVPYWFIKQKSSRILPQGIYVYYCNHLLDVDDDESTHIALMYKNEGRAVRVVVIQYRSGLKRGSFNYYNSLKAQLVKLLFKDNNLELCYCKGDDALSPLFIYSFTQAHEIIDNILINVYKHTTFINSMIELNGHYAKQLKELGIELDPKIQINNSIHEIIVSAGEDECIRIKDGKIIETFYLY